MINFSFFNGMCIKIYKQTSLLKTELILDMVQKKQHLITAQLSNTYFFKQFIYDYSVFWINNHMFLLLYRTNGDNNDVSQS